ncbi:MAG: urea ABC transporter permease subunit UrtB, partial [Pseudomonadota bacterium]
MPRLIAALLLVLSLLAPAGGAAASEIEAVLETHTTIIQKGSRKTIQPAIDALAGSGLPEAEKILERWRAKELWARKADGKFFLAERIDSKTYRLLDLLTGAEIETVAKRDLKQIKP